jgi:hypothetical protein
MTAVVITASLDPSWVRPLAALRSRGVACVVVAADAAAYARLEADARAEAAGAKVAIDPEADEAQAKRRRALRHALAEYELKVHEIVPKRSLGELLVS